MQEYWTRTRRKLIRAQIAAMIEDYVNHPSTPMFVLAVKYGVSERVIGECITEVLFSGLVIKNPVTLVLQSKMNDIPIDEE